MLSRLRHNLPAGRIPEPWAGRPDGAKIFFLTFNPGHVDVPDAYGPGWRGYAAAMLQGTAPPLDQMDDNPAGRRWTRRVYGRFTRVIETFCNLRLVAYPSRDQQALGQITVLYDELPSTRAMKKAVHDELAPRARAGEIMLLVMRSSSQWGFGRVEEDVWDGNLFISRPVRSVSISPGSRVGPRILGYLHARGVECCD